MKIGFAFIIKNKIYNWNYWKVFLGKNNYKIGIISYGNDLDPELQKYQVKTSIHPGYGDLNYVKCVLVLLNYLRNCDRVILLSETCFPLVSFKELENEIKDDKMYIELRPFDQMYMFDRIPNYIYKKIGVNRKNFSDFLLKCNAQGLIFNKKMIDFFIKNQKLVRMLENDKIYITEKNKSIDEHYWLLTIMLFGDENIYDNIEFRNTEYMVAIVKKGGIGQIFLELDEDFYKKLRKEDYLFIKKITDDTDIKYSKYLK